MGELLKLANKIITFNWAIKILLFLYTTYGVYTYDAYDNTWFVVWIISILLLVEKGDECCDRKD